MQTHSYGRRGSASGGAQSRRPFRPSSPTKRDDSRRRSFSSDRPQFSNNRPRRFESSRGRGGGGGRGGRKQTTFDVSQYINKNPVVKEVEAVYEAKHSFADFKLTHQLLTTLTSAGLTTPTPIQDQIIPHILEGRDVVGLANTGTGKTAAFLIPLIHETLKNDNRQTLILTPTRELAIQIQNELFMLSRGMRMFSTTCVGGMNIRPQISGLKRKNHFIIGTPGRVLDLIERKVLRPETVTTVVLDEADRMLDMGFIHDIKSILKDTPKDRETLFFSATMSKNIELLINDFLKDPVHISVRKKDITNNIEQDVVRTGHHDKFETLTNLLQKRTEFSKVIIFGAMKHSVEKLSVALNQHGISAESIHGNKSHGQRQRALKRFKDNQVQVLVATDVAARGIHVDNVSHVINYDLPSTYEDYVHRIGRTGRGIHSGKALTFVH